MIKAVIFDVGGVLVRTEDQSGRRLLEQRYHLLPGGAEQLVFNSPMAKRAQRGELTAGALWAWVARELGLDQAALAEFQRCFWAGDRMDEELVNYLRKLKGSYQTAIISNALDNLCQVLTDVYPMADAFHVIVGSAHERVMKPNPAIFRQALALLKRQAAEAIFVDDFMHNVEGARAVGMHAIHYTPGLDVPAALARYGVSL